MGREHALQKESPLDSRENFFFFFLGKMTHFLESNFPKMTSFLVFNYNLENEPQKKTFSVVLLTQKSGIFLVIQMIT